MASAAVTAPSFAFRAPPAASAPAASPAASLSAAATPTTVVAAARWVLALL